MDQDRRTCRLVRAGAAYDGRQGLTYGAGVSAESVGSRALCMHLVTVPPGGRAQAHLHENHESAIYVVSGESEVWYGDDLEERLLVRAGEFMYIPEGVPHLPTNASVSEPCVAVLARTDPNEQERVVPLPDLDARFASRRAE